MSVDPDAELAKAKVALDSWTQPARETLRAAARALQNGTPMERALCALLHEIARVAEIRIGVWREAEQDVPGLTRIHYGLALAVARAALAEMK